MAEVHPNFGRKLPHENCRRPSLRAPELDLACECETSLRPYLRRKRSTSFGELVGTMTETASSDGSPPASSSTPPSSDQSVVRSAAG